MLVHDTVEEVDEADFPQAWHSAGFGGSGSGDEGLTFPISYHFEPGAADDGITIDVPVATLNQVTDEDFSWHVPGLREELVASLIRSLPKQLRVSFVPAPNTAAAFLAAVPPGEEPLLDALERYLRSTTGVVVPREAWDWSKLPAHLRPTYRVVDEGGAEQGRGKDLEALKEPLRPQFAAAVAEVAADTTATGETTWSFGELPAEQTWKRAGHEVRGFPALVDEGATVGLQVCGSPQEAEARHRLGVARLLLLALPQPDLLAGLDNTGKLALAGSPYPTVAELVEDCRRAVVLDAVDARPPVRDRAAYDALLTDAAAMLEPRMHEVLATVTDVLGRWRRADKALSGRAELATLPSMTDMRDQLARLVHRGFVAEAGPTQLRRYPTYLTALEQRRQRLDEQAGRDRQQLDRIADLQEAYLHQVAALPEGRPASAALREVRWLLEEYRVSLWAQQLGTPRPVSDQRIRKALAAAT
jgi:ATP-dependent helicase HrpA